MKRDYTKKRVYFLQVYIIRLHKFGAHSIRMVGVPIGHLVQQCNPTFFYQLKKK